MKPLARELIEPLAVLPKERGRAGDRRTRWAVGGPVELAENDVAHPISGILEVVVGFVLHPHLSAGGQIGPEVRARDVEERADDVPS